jgi:acyl-CoA reductase-like NAD-dependent aldehyde dehydrogenase
MAAGSIRRGLADAWASFPTSRLPCSANIWALGVAKRIQSGICHINAPTVHDEGQMPFGGTKAAGYGRLGGTAAIDEFTELRWITTRTGPHPYPF